MFQSHDWPQAAMRWLAIREEFPDDWRPVIDLANAYKAPALFAEADAILREGVDRFPDEIAILRDFAGLAIQQGHYDEALARANKLRERFPHNPDGYAVAGEALQMLGRFEEAAGLLSSVGEKFTDDYRLTLQWAWSVTRLQRWDAAFKLWDGMLNRFRLIGELTNSVGDTIALWQIAKGEGDEDAIAVVLPPEVARRAGVTVGEADLSDRDLMMGFEGLGDACEFGLVQRHFGAEPVGLLRFSGINPRQLATLLRTNFDGVGEPEHTYVKVHPISREYFAGDTRYFYMHTFIKESEVPQDQVFEKFSSRLRYLTRELIDDLTAGEKIFIYKDSRAALSDEEAHAIAGALKEHYPAAKLVLMRVASNPRQTGTISIFTKNAVFGYLTHFYETTNNMSDYDGWKGVCAAARAHFGAEHA